MGGGLYFILSFHFIFYGKNFYLLMKIEPTAEKTLYSLNGKDPVKILEIDQLRSAGIGDILVETGLITEVERQNVEYELENDLAMAYPEYYKFY